MRAMELSRDRRDNDGERHTSRQIFQGILRKYVSGKDLRERAATRAIECALFLDSWCFASWQQLTAQNYQGRSLSALPLHSPSCSNSPSSPQFFGLPAFVLTVMSFQLNLSSLTLGAKERLARLDAAGGALKARILSPGASSSPPVGSAVSLADPSASLGGVGVASSTTGVGVSGESVVSGGGFRLPLGLCVNAGIA